MLFKIINDLNYSVLRISESPRPFSGRISELKNRARNPRSTIINDDN